MSFLITSAWAAAPATAPQGDNFFSLLFLLGFAAIFYFLLWRPQAKRAKAQQELLNKLAKGDEVVTTGGLTGKITRLNEDFILLQIADGVEVRIQKIAITAVLPKGTLKAA